MPLKLFPPRTDKGSAPSWTIRGTYLGCYVNKSTLAEKIRKRMERDIESGVLTSKQQTGFAAAADAYMMAGGDNRFLRPLILHLGNTPLDQIGQVAIDKAAAEVYPVATAATRNRQVSTPIIAVLRRAGIKADFERPID
jgi:hypothetical protein